MVEINLLPWRELQRIQRRKNILIILILVVSVVSVFFMILNFYMSYQINKKQKSIYFLQEDLTALSVQTGIVVSMQQEISQYQTALEIFKKYEKNQEVLLNFFKKTLQKIPGGCYLTEIIRQESKIIFSGMAVSSEALSQLCLYVNMQPFLQQAKMVEVKKSKNTAHVYFRMELSLLGFIS